jgi:hypothetical protein
VQIKLEPENSFAKHSVHVASAVALPAFALRWPATQTRRLEQNELRASLWNSVAPQTVQLGALVRVEYRPAEHTTQRSGVDSELSASYVPGEHGDLALQYG